MLRDCSAANSVVDEALVQGRPIGSTVLRKACEFESQHVALDAHQRSAQCTPDAAGKPRQLICVTNMYLNNNRQSRRSMLMSYWCTLSPSFHSLHNLSSSAPYTSCQRRFLCTQVPWTMAEQTWATKASSSLGMHLQGQVAQDRRGGGGKEVKKWEHNIILNAAGSPVQHAAFQGTPGMSLTFHSVKGCTAQRHAAHSAQPHTTSIHHHPFSHAHTYTQYCIHLECICQSHSSMLDLKLPFCKLSPRSRSYDSPVNSPCCMSC